MTKKQTIRKTVSEDPRKTKSADASIKEDKPIVTDNSNLETPNDPTLEEPSDLEATSADASLAQAETNATGPKDYDDGPIMLNRDPILMAACVGVLRDHMSQGVMEEHEFVSQAPKFISQATRLYDMLVEACQD